MPGLSGEKPSPESLIQKCQQSSFMNSWPAADANRPNTAHTHIR